MNENLPEINFKEKKEKKGFLPWFRSHLGLGARGGMGGVEGTAFRGAANLGRFGASSGVGGLLAGKAGLLVTVAAVVVGTGVYLVHNAPAPVQNSSFNSAKAPDNYVPAILRSQAQHQGSSLDMFKSTNKKAGLMLEEDAERQAEARAAQKAQAAAATSEQPDQSQNQSQPAPSNMAEDVMAKLQGGSLTSSLGAGQSKFSGMGGFGNKVGQGAFGNKVGFSSVGSGFTAMPKFDQRKKLLAMNKTSRPVFSGAKGGKLGKFGTGSFSQAKGVKATQKSYSGTGIDSMAHTQNQAWTGSTGEGTPTGGTGLGAGDGGAGIVTSPSLDNAGSAGGGGAGGTPDDPTIPDVSGNTDVSPWAGLPQKAMMYIMLSLILSAIASYLVSAGNTPATFYLKIIGWVLAGVALILGGMALMIGIQLMSSYGQTMLGMIYTIGGGCAMAAAALAFAGSSANNGSQLWMSAIAGILSMLGSMMGGK
ncbi:MAG TPA: hypothetical protein DCL44_09325 [Elusimicrobia bacterium]|nr:hypothetical protein [Elusimicrobiota bacterium]